MIRRLESPPFLHSPPNPTIVFVGREIPDLCNAFSQE